MQLQGSSLSAIREGSVPSVEDPARLKGVLGLNQFLFRRLNISNAKWKRHRFNDCEVE
jgi:hypothetical protein